jgi:hypothetical protein
MPVLSQLPIGMVSYWEFDEGSGTAASDSSGNGNTGTLMHGPQWVSGIKETALYFDGVDDYVSVPDSPTLRASGNAITVELWFKPTVMLDSGTPALEIIDKGNEYTFIMNLGPFQPTPNGKIGFLIVLEGPSWQWVETTTNQWNAETWYHLTGTYDGNYLKIYVNGELQSSQPLSGNLHCESYPLAIGSYTLGGQWLFTGVIDEVAIYNIALTPEEIQQHYQNGLNGLGYYPNPKESTQKLIETIKTWNLPKGTENSLTSKLQNAIQSLEKGQQNAAINKLNAFINEVQAQRNKKLTNEQANMLIAEAQRIINTIQG